MKAGRIPGFSDRSIVKEQMKEAEYIKDIVKEADMVLVGIGEEFEGDDYLMENVAYQQICNIISEKELLWVMPYVKAYFLKENNQLKQAYENLAKLLKNKNYFIVSVCMNGYLSKAGLRADRFVETCGSYEKMQCQKGCSQSVRETYDRLIQEVESCCKNEKDWNDLEQPTCDLCGAAYVFNSLYSEKYLEEGYSENWILYTKWLQGTVNRKLCVLELGADMMFASVTRFRFEKIVNLNQKAQLLRIHKHLYQLPEEIGNRGLGISQNSVKYMAEMTDL